MAVPSIPGAWIAVLLVPGIVVLGLGYGTGHRIWFYAGLLITLAGVLLGLQRIILGGGTGHPGR